MRARRRSQLATLAIVGVALLAAYAALPQLGSVRSWQALAEPGPLAVAHRFVANDCASCHVPVAGVSDNRCTSCHANETTLLQRQPTAFHSSIGHCAECHREHEGDVALRPRMDHAALASIGQRVLAREPRGSAAYALYSRVATREGLRTAGRTAAVLPSEQALDCAGCHSSGDRHGGQFGPECGACHGTVQWAVPRFRHPSPSSTDCAQCHRAPPSHYMGHFEMVSKRVARAEHADVEQCHLCHQTTSWNDIKGMGLYDHH
jgi:hypothetical protein